MIRFFVPGIPAGKGSFKAFMPRGGRFPIVTNDSAKTRPWEQAVRAEAEIAGCNRLIGPVRVELAFFFPRLQSHIGAHGLRPSAPADHTKKPDLDKLIRTVLDALTAVAFTDDAQVIEILARKDYVAEDAQPGVRITVAALDAAAVEGAA